LLKKIYKFCVFVSGKVGTMFQSAKHVGSVAARWGFNPSYMHTFCVTDNFFVIIEQPLSVSVPAMMKNAIIGEPMIASFRWYPNEKVHILIKFYENCYCYLNFFPISDSVLPDFKIRRKIKVHFRDRSVLLSSHNKRL
jgi:hypothetical protein